MATKPRAENGLSSYEFNILRRTYISRAYPLLADENAIDLWYGPKVLYGKVDQNLVPQLLAETNLKTILSSPDLLAIDFVVDAFEDFRSYVDKANRRRVISTQDSFLGLLRAKKAWISPREEYDAHIKLIYKTFVREYLSTNKKNKVVDFESFLHGFLEYLKTTSNTHPVTLSGFIKSKHLSHACSGLTIELDDLEYDEDRNKFDIYYQSNHFRFYQNAARKYGFRIDYNAPWRMVADITTPEMGEYMERYFLRSTREFFEDYYYDAYKLEVAIIKSYLVQLYNSYAINNSLLKIVSAGSSNFPRIRSKIIRRRYIPETEIDKKYNNLFWLKYYLDLREIELPRPIDKRSKDKKIMEMAYIIKTIDFDSALQYINRELMTLERG